MLYRLWVEPVYFDLVMHVRSSFEFFDLTNEAASNRSDFDYCPSALYLLVKHEVNRSKLYGPRSIHR